MRNQHLCRLDKRFSLIEPLNKFFDIGTSATSTTIKNRVFVDRRRRYVYEFKDSLFDMHRWRGAARPVRRLLRVRRRGCACPPRLGEYLVLNLRDANIIERGRVINMHLSCRHRKTTSCKSNDFFQRETEEERFHSTSRSRSKT